MIVDLDKQDLINILKQIQVQHYIKEILFYVTIDLLISVKLKKIALFLPYLSKYPTIKGTIVIKQIKAFEPVYGTVAVGGTFDHFHLGHQVLLLYTALSASQRIYIGISGIELLNKKKSKQMLEPWPVRKKNVQNFVKAIKPQIQVICFELKDRYGITSQVEDIDGLILSEETIDAGKLINDVRASKQMNHLKVVVCPTISPNYSIEKKLSSTSIRQSLLEKNKFTIEQYNQYRAYFLELIQRLGASKRQNVQNWWQELFQRYSEHWRFYHSNQHIFKLLRQWKSQQFSERRLKLNKNEVNMIETAIFFHDIIYRPDLKTNEEQSAKLALSFLQSILQESQQKSTKQIVQRLILQTKNHEPTCQLSQIIYDLDMGILNSNLKDYKEYAKTIKKQYQPLYGQGYAQKRCEYLKKWKESKHFFSFNPQNMQQNLSWELFCLQNNDL